MSHIADADKARVVNRIAREFKLPDETSLALFQSVVDFLTMKAAHPQRQFVPSIDIDRAWHVFLLFSRVYREFCVAIAGKPIDHEPADDEEDHGRYEELYLQTLVFMQEQGITYSKDLWPSHESAGCSAGCEVECNSCH